MARAAVVLAALSVLSLAAPAVARAPTTAEGRELHWMRARLAADREAEKTRPLPEAVTDAEAYLKGTAPLGDWDKLTRHVKNKDEGLSRRLGCVDAILGRLAVEAGKQHDPRALATLRKSIARDLVELWRKDDSNGWMCLGRLLDGLFPNAQAGNKELDSLPGASGSKRAQAHAAWTKFLRD